MKTDKCRSALGLGARWDIGTLSPSDIKQAIETARREALEAAAERACKDAGSFLVEQNGSWTWKALHETIRAAILGGDK